MSEESKRYTVMELADLLGVPRTTINDWLNRYSQYIDFVPQGKRKVYPESAVAVLREIAALRNGGKSFSDIETELSAKHPIRAVPVPPDEIKIPPSSPVPNSSPVTGVAAPDQAPVTAVNGEFAVIARQQSEEIGRLIGESFRSMDQRIQELETLSAAQRKMSAFWLFAFFLFLVFLIAGGMVSWHYLELAKQENLVLRQHQQENEQKLTTLKEESVTLAAGSKAFQANIVRLESELKNQKAEFDKSLRAENQRLGELHQAKEKALLSERDQALSKMRETEARLALEKEKFAAERLKLLKELEQSRKKPEEGKGLFSFASGGETSQPEKKTAPKVNSVKPEPKTTPSEPLKKP